MPAPTFLHGRRRSLIPSCRGFTATELMVAVSILAVLGALALPGFGRLIEHYRLRQASQDLSGTLALARSEAIRRGGHVTLRKATPSSGCSTSGDSDWSCGWLVFADTNDNGDHDAGEEPIQSSRPASGVRISVSAGRADDHLKIDRWGQFNGIGIFNVVLHPQGKEHPDAAMVMCMAAGGRLRIIEGADRCSA